MKNLSSIKFSNLEKKLSFSKFPKYFIGVKNKEELVARIHKHDISTITMVLMNI